MSEWKEYKLGDVLEIKYGKDHKSLSEGSIPAYGSGGIMRYVDKAIYSDVSILIPRKGSLNNIFYKDKPFWTVDTMFWSKINQNIAHPKFLFYQLTKIDYNNLNVGSAVPSLTVPVINDIGIILPQLKEQIQIASILSSLDDKIDLLQRQNKTFEQLAETLFRQWFVEEAGNTNPLGSISKVTTGKGLKRNEFIEKGEYPVLGANGEMGRTNKFFTKERLILTGRVGTLGQISITDSKVWISDNVLIIKPIEQKYFYPIYFSLKRIDFETLNAGSTQPLVTQTDLKMIEINSGSEAALKEFLEHCNKYFYKIKSNTTQIRTLTQLRDTLLPKLMSGEVSLSNLGEVRVNNNK